MRGFLATDEALAAARESLPRLKGLKGPYAAVTARYRTGKPHTILASSDEASIPGLAPPCFDSESYGIIESGYPGRQDLLAGLFAYRRWDGRSFHPSLPEDSPVLRAVSYALGHAMEITGIAPFGIGGDDIIPSCTMPETLWEMLGLRFIYADGCIAVADKQAGMLSVPGKGDDKLDSVSYRFHRLFPSSPEQCFTHRLDMDTSGLLVLAFSREAHRSVSMQFEARTVRKEYEALLEGTLEEDEGLIDAPMRLDPERRPLQVVDHIQGRKAITRWRKLEAYGNCTRVRFYPETGRTHQLRVHSAYIGHPILGDRLYGTRAPGERLCLHASYIELDHPASGGRISFSSPAPF